MMSSAAAKTSASVILRAEPQLFVSDIDGACRFYVQKLGFDVAFTHGDPPFYAQIVRDGARLNLRKVTTPPFSSVFRANEGNALSATLTLDDAKPLFDEFQSAGVPFHQSLKAESWGAQTFIVQDPDGNLLCFAGNAP